MPRRLRRPREVAARLLAFQDHYSNAARPFDWTFTRDDLNQLLHRLGCRDLHAPRLLAAYAQRTNGRTQ
ncbi:hypothetical protein ACQP2U_24455 [Nocardia sp. CA-084685]|uniref:hypothetical protein n=1 Tax=Nocardia sp. CA-084685 TaxID=3239970 RepID=UPI003D993E0B